MAKDERSDDEEEEEEEQQDQSLSKKEERKTPEVRVNGQPVDEKQESQRNLRLRKKN